MSTLAALPSSPVTHADRGVAFVCICVYVCKLPDMLKEHTEVVRGRESVSAFPVCSPSEMHPTQSEEQLLDHEDFKCSQSVKV